MNKRETTLPLKSGSLFKDEWEYVCNRYRDRFVEMYFTCDDGFQANTDWIADRTGEILDVNDGEYVFSMDEIRLCVDNNYKWDDIQAWWNYTMRIRTISDNITVPNLESWMKGCPRRSEEELQHLETLHRKAVEQRELLEKYIKEFNETHF